MKKASKKGKKGLFLRKNKKFYGGFVLLFALVILINATLAWSSYTEWVKNHTQSNPEEIAVDITEEFKQDSVLAFEEAVKKSVKVKNISKRDAIIRVNFNESIMPFVIDMEDGENAGGLKIYKRTTEDVIEVNNIDTWGAGKLVDSGMDEGSEDLYYQAASPVHKMVPYAGEAKRMAASSPAELKFFEWTFNSKVYDTPQMTPTDAYWVFDGEYYYYSQVLEGGATTTIDLLQAVGLRDMLIPNKYKNALYNIQVEAEGTLPNKDSLQKWTNDSDILAMFKQDDKFG